jgi:hypothetical protein
MKQASQRWPTRQVLAQRKQILAKYRLAKNLRAENAMLRQAAENLVDDIVQALAKKKGVQPTRCEGPQPKPEKVPPL